MDKPDKWLHVLGTDNGLSFHKSPVAIWTSNQVLGLTLCGPVLLTEKKSSTDIHLVAVILLPFYCQHLFSFFLCIDRNRDSTSSTGPGRHRG